jgi:hypothetical protein
MTRSAFSAASETESRTGRVAYTDMFAGFRIGGVHFGG